MVQAGGIKTRELCGGMVKTMDCPVIRVDGTKPVDVNIDYILEYIK